MKRLNNLFRYTHILFNFKVSKPLRVKFCLVLSVPFVYIILKHGLLVNPLHWGLTLNPLQRC